MKVSKFNRIENVIVGVYANSKEDMARFLVGVYDGEKWELYKEVEFESVGGMGSFEEMKREIFDEEDEGAFLELPELIDEENWDVYPAVDTEEEAVAKLTEIGRS